METYYLIIVAFLFILAISDLVVGVSNDAVNFLNSAIGSKVAPFNIIILIAAAGVLVGATFSSGMMEVARSGIFHPDMFYFNEIMLIFLAVMITDVILLDMFNTFGLPTSTTVSIVFELLGAAVAISIMKISQAAEGISNLAYYINTDRALGIISGIFLSILISFTFGAVIQWFIRVLFSFNISKTIKYWGGLWGGLSITAIIYFLVVKGAAGASFMNESLVNWINANTGLLILYSFISGTFLFQLLIWLTNINVLKIIVLLGTFSLAMAFAGNDLVNFIGVPLAGFESFKIYIASGLEPDGLVMEMLKGKVKTPTFMLLAAGLVMAITLKYSKKARSVTATTIDLSNQDERTERFESSALARFLVRKSLELSYFFNSITPKRIQHALERRFDQSVLSDPEKKQQEILAFDLVRASVNLVVASILIAIGTSLKLPLSTTYVTFMVAMGSSLSDGAWGRESAVYRITGVITVVGGWFMTAFIAFTAAFFIALGLYFGGMLAIVGFIALSVFILVRTHTIHKRRSKESDQKYAEDKTTSQNIITNCSDTVRKITINVSKLYYLAILNFTKENRKDLQQIRKEVKELNQETKMLKSNIHTIIRKLKEDEVESGHYYVQILDYLRETTNCLYYVVNPMFLHVDNNHPPLAKEQAEELLQFNEKMSDFFNFALNILKNNKFEKYPELIEKRNKLLLETTNLKKKQIKSLKKSRRGSKVILLYLEIMTESKNMLLFATNVIQAQNEFLDHGMKKPVS